MFGRTVVFLFAILQMAVASRSLYTFSIVSSVPQIIIPDAQVNRGINGQFEVHLNETPKVFDLEVRDHDQERVQVVRLIPHSKKQSVVFHLGNQEIQIEYKFGCMTGFYGEKCNIPCFSWKDDHFTCSKLGEKICDDGWSGENCTIREPTPAPPLPETTVTTVGTTTGTTSTPSSTSSRKPTIKPIVKKSEDLVVEVLGTSEPAEASFLDTTGFSLRIGIIALLLLLAVFVLLLSICFRRKSSPSEPILPVTVKSDSPYKNEKEKNPSRPHSPRYTGCPVKTNKTTTPEVNGAAPPHYISTHVGV